MSGTSSRMLALLSLLQARRDWPGDVLAGRLDVSVRTVRRDVDRLRELGYRIDASRGPDGGYRLDAGAELPPLLFDDDQVVALAIALQAAPASGADIAEPAERALATLRRVMPSRVRHRVEGLASLAVTPATASVDPAVLEAVSTATREREVLRFDYASVGQDATTPRRVEPRAVVAVGGRWYLVAFDLERDDWRVFRVDRISPRMPTRQPFAPRDVPGGDAAAFVRGRFRGATDGGSGWPCVGTVELEVPAAEIAPYLLGTGVGAAASDPDTVLEPLGEHRCRVTLGAWSWIALAARFAGFDAAMSAAEPRALVTAFGTLAERSHGVGSSRDRA